MGERLLAAKTPTPPRSCGRALSRDGVACDRRRVTRVERGATARCCSGANVTPADGAAGGGRHPRRRRPGARMSRASASRRSASPSTRRTGVIVDDRLRTTNPRVYAAGDVCSAHKFTHNSDAQARIVIQNALFLGRARTSALLVPVHVHRSGGRPRRALRARRQRAASRPHVRPGAGGRRPRGPRRRDRGFVKVHVGRDGPDPRRDHRRPSRGRDAARADACHRHGTGLGRIARVIHTYPTQAEAIRKLGDAYNRTRLTPPVKRLFETWLRWAR